MPQRERRAAALDLFENAAGPAARVDGAALECHKLAAIAPPHAELEFGAANFNAKKQTHRTRYHPYGGPALASSLVPPYIYSGSTHFPPLN